MSYRTPQTAGNQGGGAVCLLQNPGRARNIHVCILNPTASTHAAYFANSRRELQNPGTIGIAGLALVAVPNTVVNQTVNGVSYSSYILQGWSGELWVSVDADNTGLQIDAFESAAPEK